MSIDGRIGDAHVRFTGRAEGDMGHGGAYVHAVRDDVAARRRAVVDLPWTWLRQVHGDDVVRVTAPGAGAGSKADGSVTDQAGCALAVLTADCAPVVLAGRGRGGGSGGSGSAPIGVAHAGWVGTVGGVLQRAVKEMRALGATDVVALIGPCIHAECYEFGPADLARVADRYGPQVEGRTSDGRPALDLVATVRAALAEADVTDVDDVGVCSACSADGYYSWRARRETERQAAVVWKDGAGW